jgi:asparagine synthase (glutamine-hydrolysing)
VCGITGFFSKHTSVCESVCQHMVSRLSHRGPDSKGVWVDSQNGIALGHSRLAILELSVAGHQPMVSACKRFVLVFNGEIYNHLAMRKNLVKEGYDFSWRGHSDTETLVAAISVWGVKKALQESTGMFALALWDRHKMSLTLARDRMGEKPVYYGWQGNSFIFGSELDAIKVHPQFENTIDRDSLCLLLRHNTISNPHSIYKGISKLSPGTILTLSSKNNTIKLDTYWSMQSVVRAGMDNPFNGSHHDAVLGLESLLSSAVFDQMQSDVPLGAFLSGGIDSSTIVSLMQSQSNKKINTFSIGFSEKEYDEAQQAKAIAKYLGTDHTELYVSHSDALRVIPQLPKMFDEPFADSSQIPTYLVSQLAKRHVDVALTGDGGDELFGGYNRHIWIKSIWSKTRYLPLFVRRLIYFAITSLSPTSWNKFFDMCSVVFPHRYRVSQPGEKMYKLAKVILDKTPVEMYRDLVSHWNTPESIVLGSNEPKTKLLDFSELPNLYDIEQRMMFLDTISYMPDDILTKVDRAAMAVSLETRIPMLDQRVVEFAWSLPLDYKIRNGQGKWILRELLNKYVPQELVERPKMGFGVPLHNWLRGPLLDWSQNLLNPTKLRNQGYFNTEAVLQKWNEHLSGKRDWQHHLWDILMFQAWLEENQ